MDDFTFLTYDDCFGDNELEILKKRGREAQVTDYAALLGAFKEDFNNDFGYYWTKTYDSYDGISTIVPYGQDDFFVSARDCSVRPAIKYSSLDDILENNRASDGVLEVEYGYYPQRAVRRSMQSTLETAFINNEIAKTNNKFTVYPIRFVDDEEIFEEEIFDEYIYNEEKYVRMINDPWHGGTIRLSNGERYTGGDVVWVKVEPVKWLIDEKKKVMLTEKLLFSGLKFNNKERYDCTFEETDIYKYMNTVFAKELFQTVAIQNKSPLKSDSEKLNKKNPYNFDFSNVTEEDIIRGMIESDISVFLHGMSGDGKSARVKQLDPDCEIIYLRNATPDSLNGKSVYDPTSGEMIDVQPTWYKKVCKKCEDEPDKIHIVFFDEITNALPSVQGMAFNIVLDGEVNGKWKLPENARIVAAGNDLNDSLSANTLSEPLFNRFAHVYINTTVDSWLKWAITPKQNYERLDYVKEEEHLIIHPAIYTYILYKRYCRQDALRTPYNGEKPNADPRKWEMASKVLYSTGRPEMLRALIGEDLTRDFVAFTNQKVITVDDVLKKNYSDEDLVMDLAEKYATVVGLSSVSFENVEEVRNFVIDNLEKEFIALFDNLWTRGDDERLERIAELKMQESTKGKKKIKRK